MKPALVLRRRTGVVLAAAALTLAGCTRHVTRIAPEQAIDLSGRWNDVDSRLVAESLIQQSFDSGTNPHWALRHSQVHGGKPPTVIVGAVVNRSLDHVPTNTFVRDLERAYIRSGLVNVVASGGERADVRDERLDQQEHAAENTRARLRMETGADYMLQGEIQSIEDREGGKSVVYYQVDLTLTDLQSNGKVWVGQHKIKKFIQRSRFGL